MKEQKVQSVDFIIIGSGVAAVTVARELLPLKKKIVILEAGAPAPPRQQMLDKYYASRAKTPNAGLTSFPEAPAPRTLKIKDYYHQTGPENFTSTYERLAGGTTWHWLGTTPRFNATDFKMKSTFGKAQDWPITLEELESFYAAAEKSLGVVKDFPLTYLDRTLKKRFKGKSYKGFALDVKGNPQARKSHVCMSSHSCVPLCPTGAKYEAYTPLREMVAKGQVTLITRAVVKRLHATPKGDITHLEYVDWSGPKAVAKTMYASHFILAAGGIETPKLLLMSSSKAFPKGLANGSDQVGRNLMDHPIHLSWAETKEALYPYRGPLSTSGIDSVRDGGFRGLHAAHRLEIHNSGWQWPAGGPAALVNQFLARGLWGETLKEKLRYSSQRHLLLTSLMEQLPHPQNRVTLSSQKDALGFPRPQVFYELTNYERRGIVESRKLRQHLFTLIGCNQINHGDTMYGAGHIMGTTRMGHDPKTSCVDKNLKAHQHPNLFVAGSSVFPTGGTANPTLTLVALAHRLGKHIAKLF